MAAPSSHMWYVRAAGGVWGPYPEARVAAFVAEGRVRAETLISPWSEGPFAPAAASAEFTALFQPPAQPASPSPRRRAAEPRAAPTAALMPDRPAPVLHVLEPLQALPRAALRPLLVWAELSGRSVAGFQSALAASGPSLAIRPGLWLVRGSASAAALRNQLSRHLGATDALLVVEAPLEQAAWFNLDPDRDRELRQMWSAA